MCNYKTFFICKVLCITHRYCNRRQLDQALILLGSALDLLSTAVSSVLVVLCILDFSGWNSLLYLLMSWTWWDWPLTWLINHCPSVLWHCWLGHLTHKLSPNWPMMCRVVGSWPCYTYTRIILNVVGRWLSVCCMGDLWWSYCTIKLLLNRGVGLSQYCIVLDGVQKHHKIGEI